MITTSEPPPSLTRPGEQTIADTALFQVMARHAPVMMWISDLAGVRTFFSEAWLEFTGRTTREERGHGWTSQVHPDDRARCVITGSNDVARKRVPVRLEYRLRRRDGVYRWLLDDCAPVHTPDGTFVGYIGSCVDITDRREIEDQLRKREAQLADAQRVARLGSWEIDLSTGAHAWSEEMYRICGLERTVTRPSLDAYVGVIHPEDRDEAIASTLPSESEHRIVRPDGSVRVVKNRSEVQLDPRTGAPMRILGTVLDVTEARAAEAESKRTQAALCETEARLRQSQKMDAIGRLAGGIAHDFNNLLTAILTSATFLREAMDADDPRSVDADEILGAGARAAALTSQLLAFTRQQVIAPRTVDLNALVTNVERMLRRVIGEDIELATAFATDDARVHADPCQLEQILLNLAVNARDAMPTGGLITIETSLVDLTDDTCRRNCLGATPGSYVMLAVSDTGCGMTKDVLARIFEPFFTTKEHGKGTGLGLATVYGIVQQSKGDIRVYSEPCCGTTFAVYLPRSSGAKSSASMPEDAVRRGTETILLVEDEAAVRRLARRALSDLGYRVLEAARPSQAIDVVETHEGAIDLLLTDIVMPEANGMSLAQHLTEKYPMKVLFMSGYSEHAVLDRDALASNFVQKPFSPALLARRIREVLDGVSDE